MGRLQNQPRLLPLVGLWNHWQENVWNGLTVNTEHGLLKGCLTCYLRDRSWGYWPDLRGWSRGLQWPAYPRGRRRTDSGPTPSLTSSVIFRQALEKWSYIINWMFMFTVPTWLSLAEHICEVAIWHELGWCKWLGRKSRTWGIWRLVKTI